MGVKKMEYPTTQELQDAYSKYLRRYITKEIEHQDLPDGVPGKLFSTTIGDFVITHIHHNGGSGFQSGTVTFTFNESPFWVLNYKGKYPKKIVPFVIEALHDGLLTGEPLLRGPDIIRTPDLTYINTVKGDIVDFSGEEMVVKFDDTKTSDVLGRLKYSGGLVPHPQCQVIE